MELENNSLEGVTHCIQCVLPHHIVGSNLFKKNVCYYMAESMHTKFNVWHQYLNLVDEVWVPNDDLLLNTKNFLRDTKIKKLPLACDTDRYYKDHKELDFAANKYRYKLYFIGDLNERKNLEGTIRCYYNAFNNTDNVVLVCKIKKYGLSPRELEAHSTRLTRKIQHEMRIHENSKYYPPIVFITESVNDEFIDSLHKTCDCYVGISRGEAWSIPAFDAMCFGNQVICSNEGGPKSFISESDYPNAKLINGSMTTCNQQDGAFSHIFTGKEFWFEADQLDVVNAMIEFKNAEASQVDTKQISNQYSYKSIGNYITELLNE